MRLIPWVSFWKKNGLQLSYWFWRDFATEIAEETASFSSATRISCLVTYPLECGYSVENRVYDFAQNSYELPVKECISFKNWNTRLLYMSWFCPRISGENASRWELVYLMGIPNSFSCNRLIWDSSISYAMQQKSVCPIIQLGEDALRILFWTHSPSKKNSHFMGLVRLQSQVTNSEDFCRIIYFLVVKTKNMFGHHSVCASQKNCTYDRMCKKFDSR